MESGKHKKRINYTVMVVSDSPEGGIRPFCLEQKLVTAVFILIGVILAVAVGTALHHSSALKKTKAQETQMQKTIETLTEENRQLTEDNAELSDKVALLSDTVAQNEEAKKEQEKEAEARMIPSGFPLAGPAVILESSETPAAETDGDTEAEADAEEAAEENAEETAGELEPVVVFSAAPGTKVIATADGTVAAVEADGTYGNRVIVDHGNGYQSVYRTISEPQVSEGDTVEAGSPLYEIQSEEDRLGYQISKDGTLIDPLELLEVYG